MRVQSKYNVRDHKGRLLIGKGDIFEAESTIVLGHIRVIDNPILGRKLLDKRNFIQLNGNIKSDKRY